MSIKLSAIQLPKKMLSQCIGFFNFWYIERAVRILTKQLEEIPKKSQEYTRISGIYLPVIKKLRTKKRTLVYPRKKKLSVPLDMSGWRYGKKLFRYVDESLLSKQAVTLCIDDSISFPACFDFDTKTLSLNITKLRIVAITPGWAHIKNLPYAVAHDLEDIASSTAHELTHYMQALGQQLLKAPLWGAVKPEPGYTPLGCKEKDNPNSVSTRQPHHLQSAEVFPRIEGTKYFIRTYFKKMEDLYARPLTREEKIRLIRIIIAEEPYDPIFFKGMSISWVGEFPLLKKDRPDWWKLSVKELMKLV